MAEIILKILTVWFSINIVIVATAWYAGSVIIAHWPDWWEREIMGTTVEFLDIE